jgi:hypothetical protein
MLSKRVVKVMSLIWGSGSAKNRVVSFQHHATTAEFVVFTSRLDNVAISDGILQLASKSAAARTFVKLDTANRRISDF